MEMMLVAVLYLEMTSHSIRANLLAANGAIAEMAAYQEEEDDIYFDIRFRAAIWEPNPHE